MATPIKFSDKTFCFICKSESRKYCILENKTNVQKNILKYLGLNIVSGRLCESCQNRLATVEKKCTELLHLYHSEECKQGFKRLSKSSPLKKEYESSRKKSVRSFASDEQFVSTCNVSGEWLQYGITFQDETYLSSEIMIAETEEISRIEDPVECSSSNMSNADNVCVVPSICIGIGGSEEEEENNIFKSLPFADCSFMHTYATNEPAKQNKKQKKTKLKKTMPCLDDSGIDVQHENEQSGLITNSNVVKDMNDKCEVNVLSSADIEELKRLILHDGMQVVDLVQLIMTISTLKMHIENYILDNARKQAKLLRKRKWGYVSKLMRKNFDDLKTIDFIEIVEELRYKFPFLYQLMVAMAMPDKREVSSEDIQKFAPQLSLCYGIIMKQSFHELSLIQCLNSALLLDNIVEKKVYDRFQKLGICLCYSASLTLMKNVSSHFQDTIVDSLKSGKTIRIIGDNVNWSVKVHDEQLGHTSHMKHAFASVVCIDDTDDDEISRMSVEKPLNCYKTYSFLPSESDSVLIEKKYMHLIAGILTVYVPFFAQFASSDMNGVKLNGNKNDTASKRHSKQTLAILPVLMKNEQRYDEVTEILDSYEDMLYETTAKAGIDIDVHDIRIQLSGDQLTRERFSGAKCLRAHHTTARDRYEHLTPITFGFFHMRINFLKLIFDRMFDTQSVDEMGTLKNIKERLCRKQVSDDVKNAFDADTAFMNTVTRAYVILLALEYFGMEDINSSPTKNVPCGDLQEWFSNQINNIVMKYIVEQDCPVVEDGHIQRVQLSSGAIDIIQRSNKLPVVMEEDYVCNYSRNIIHLGLFNMILEEMVSKPNREEGLSILKHAMLYFKCANTHSKYANEVLRLLVHQLCTLSEKEATLEYNGFFVNTTGKEDSYVSSDLQMEYIVCMVKKHIKHMQSGQTLHNIQVHSTAICGLAEIGEHFDKTAQTVIRCTKHKHIDDSNDVLFLVNDLREHELFTPKSNRYHKTFSDISFNIIEDIDAAKLQKWLTERAHVFATELGN